MLEMFDGTGSTFKSVSVRFEEPLSAKDQI